MKQAATKKNMHNTGDKNYASLQECELTKFYSFDEFSGCNGLE